MGDVAKPEAHAYLDRAAGIHCWAVMWEGMGGGLVNDLSWFLCLERTQMARPTVFYAWQSDLPKRTTRASIHDAAQAAIVRVANSLSLIDSPRIDHDTLDESGAPAITETILRKIKESAVFIADVSLVGATDLKMAKVKSACQIRTSCWNWVMPPPQSAGTESFWS